MLHKKLSKHYIGSSEFLIITVLWFIFNLHFWGFPMSFESQFIMVTKKLMCFLQNRMQVNVQICFSSQLFIFWYIILDRNLRLKTFFLQKGLEKLLCDFIIDLNPLCCVGKELEGVAKSALFALKWSSKLMGS